MKILIVEDAESTREFTLEVLSDLGHSAIAACDGHQALEILDSEKDIDLIISDWIMPRMSGEELLEYVRSKDKFDSIPFFIMTTQSDFDGVAKIIDKGADDYIFKPFSPQVLAKKIERANHKAESQRQKMAEIFKEENHFLQAMLHSMNDLLLVVDTNGTIQRINRPLREKLRNPRNLLGKKVDQCLKSSIANEELGYKYAQQKRALLHLDSGDYVPVLISSEPIQIGDNIEGYVICGKDIEKEDAYHTELIHLEKWKSIGQMAGEIAHEVNNPLGIIQGNAEILISALEADNLERDNLKLRLERIFNTSERISNVISSLLKLSRNEVHEYVEKDLLQIIDEGAMICQEKFREKAIQFEVHTSIKEAKVLCQGTQFSQVLLNLLSNSFDAIKESQNPWIRVELKEIGEHYRLKVIDSGNGIPKDKQEKIFMPFYSSKESGNGTGLGLSISKSIMMANNGDLYIDTSIDNTCLVMEIPKKEIDTRAAS